MEREVIEILSEYLSPQAAANLLARAKARLAPTTPQDWARLLEGPLWEELRAILPFREMPPGLKALVRRLKAVTPPPPKPQGEAVPEAAPALEAVDLADPEERDRLARSLARLEGVTGVVVAHPSGKAELPEGFPVPLDTAHLLLRRQGYALFYLRTASRLLLLRPVGGGFVGVTAREEANVGQLMHRLKRLAPKEVSG
ncbi:hypothetical protein TthSNM11_23160 [Thermus thermophilus]|uniref:hypothetical protein n=1 Tax=Thermus thermophilus TaxID=274 RepID=UPI001FCC9F28|nr:hypothetical protein [Thermus thermophilus]BDG20113.1 hypothetical protein TthSNM11_23160 [Thermus thermophilus]